MHLKIRILIVMIIVCTLLLASCGMTKVTYEKGFPEEKSPALTHFVEHLISKHDYFVSKQDNKNLYVKDLKKDEQKLNIINIQMNRWKNTIKPF